MTGGINGIGVQLLSLVEGGNAEILLLLGLVGVGAVRLIHRLLVHGHIAGEGDGIAAGAEEVALAVKVHGQGRQIGRLHLAGDEALPDELVEAVLIRGQLTAHHSGLDLHAGGTDGLVGILRRGAGLIDAGGLGVVAVAVLLTDEGSGGGLSVGRDAEGVGTHVGDQTLYAAEFRAQIHALVQLLRHPHDSLGLEAQLAGGLLLHGGGSEGRSGILLTGGALDAVHGKSLTLHGVDDLHGLGLIRQADLTVVVAEEAGGEGLALGGDEGGIDGPVLLGHEGADLVLAIHDDLGGHGLYTSRGQAASHRLPQEGRELVAHDTVQNTAGLLGIDQIHIDGSGLLDGGLDHGLGDLVEGDALDLLHGDTQRVGQMPGNSLALAIRVGCEEDLACVLGLLLDLLDDVALAADVDVVSGEVILDVYAQRAFGQVADVTHRGDDLVVGAQIALDGACLGGRLHDDQIGFCHVILYSFRWLCRDGSAPVTKADYFLE